MSIEFDSWNDKKRVINNKINRIIVKQREIYYIHIGYNVGYENNGKGEDFLRPVIVFKKFNKEMFLGIPLTSQLKDDRPFYYEFEFNKRGEIIKNTALLSQIRLFSTKRTKQKIGTISIENFNEMRNKFKKMID